MSVPRPIDVTEIAPPGTADADATATVSHLPVAVPPGTPTHLAPAPVDPVATAVAGLQAKLTYSRQVAMSGLVPKALRTGSNGAPLPAEQVAANVFIVMEYGQLLGLHPMTAMSEVHVLDGKPGCSAKVMRAQALKAGHDVQILEHTNERATVHIKRADGKSSTPFTFTLEDAVKAELCTITPEGNVRARSKYGAIKPWEAYTATMLLERATANAVRATCPEVLMGVSYTIEELEAMDDADQRERVPSTSTPDPATPVTKAWAMAQVLEAVGGDKDAARAAWANLFPDEPETFTHGAVMAALGRLPKSDGQNDQEPADGPPAAPERAPVVHEASGDVTVTVLAHAAPEPDDDAPPPAFSLDDLEQALMSSGKTEGSVLVRARRMAADFGVPAPTTYGDLAPGVLLDALVQWVRG